MWFYTYIVQEPEPGSVKRGGASTEAGGILKSFATGKKRLESGHRFSLIPRWTLQPLPLQP